MTPRRVVIVGGGAAGLMAAGQAAEAGADSLVLEKMKTPGRKLRITGKGRCNLTNTAEQDEFISHFGRNGRFLRQAFNRFSPSDLVEFLEKIDVSTVYERGGRVFPAGNDAPGIVRALVRWAKAAGAKIRTSAPVEGLLTHDGRITGVRTRNGATIETDSVIIATGGASYPATGSTGDGYRLAESVGHKIMPIRPSLVPVETAGNIAKKLDGLSLRNVKVSFRADAKKKGEAFGEMRFTDFGLSGPIILNLSKQIVRVLIGGNQVTLSIDLKPALDDRQLDARLLRDFEAQNRKTLSKILAGLLPQKLIQVCIDLTGVPADKTGSQITAAERKKLRSWLKDFHLEVTGHRPFEEAIITAGGVDTREIDPRTMTSRLIRGLYLAGEVIDIDADTGGFNLQAAFSTGWVAGRAAANER
jgi:predicted Rossmann fold flavoprotein